MAYAALVSLEQTTHLILNHDKYSISFDEQEKIASIREYVIFLTSFLENFPERASPLEGKIRDVASEAEDVIEYLMGKQSWMGWWVFGLSRDEFGQQLQRVRQEMGSVAGDVMDDRPHDLRPAAISSSSLVVPSGKNDVVIGVNDDLMTIKGQLCGESSKLQVIPIVGMGGIGKTTLARNAYDDQLIMERFEVRAWVTVSQDYRAIEIFSRLLDSVKLFEEHHNKTDSAEGFLSSLLDSKKVLEEQMAGPEDEVAVSEKVFKSLKGRRYLIVMDDVWSIRAWDDLRKIFPDDSNGSRIMLTTRLSNVAAYANYDGPLHEMKFMDEEQSWNLLKHKVFTNDNGQDYCPLELEVVGREIAQSCGGLPLAVVLVAGILSTVAKAPASWKKIAENVGSITNGQLEWILSLSYVHLPHHLRPCLLFLSAFSEDNEIIVSRLIKIWVAEGFLKHQNGYKSLEEEAEEYLEDLVTRSLVLVTSRKSNGKIKSCSLHDLVRDLCIRKAREEKFLLHVGDRYVLKEIQNERRIISSHDLQLYFLSSTVHTIVCPRTCSSSLALLRSCRLLRVLDVVINDSFVPLPSQVFELFHLRYLALGNYIKIPSGISKLENLQTLIICPRTTKSGQCRPIYSYLPLEIWRMPRLRHLVFVDFYMLPDPRGLTLPLENLQTLAVVTNLKAHKRILKMIPNVKKMVLVYSRNQEHHLHNLVHLHQLEKLKITLSQSFSWKGHPFPVFPRMLKKLTLVGGRLPWKDMTIVGSLPNLEVLKLRYSACEGNTWETREGEFPKLKFLFVEESHLPKWITESSHFPRLKRLVLHRCRNLLKIPDAIGDIPTLELIEVDDYKKSLMDTAKQILEDQQGYGNDAFQVRCIRSDQVESRRLETKSNSQKQGMFCGPILNYLCGKVVSLEHEKL